MNENTLYIIRGLPGSGKSTLAKQLPFPNFEADQYMMKNGEYCFNLGNLNVAHKKCFQGVEYAMTTGEKGITVSNTFTQLWEMEEYFLLAKNYGYSVQVITCQGKFKSVHNVPDSKMRIMKDRFQNDVSYLYKKYFQEL